MHKRILSEQVLYYGDVTMPKGWDIDRDKLQEDILKSQITDSPFPFSRTFDMLNTYMRDHVNLEYAWLEYTMKITDVKADLGIYH